MKVIICGAGQVGFNIARYLAPENDVTVIDRRPELVAKISDQLDVQGITGHAAHPPVLEQAGAGDCEMLIAVTQSDEVNMVACQVAHSLFNVPRKIARIRHQSYLDPIYGDLFSRDHLPIDVIISPEVEVARAIARRLHVPGAFDVIPLADDKVRAAGVRLTRECPVINTPLRQLTTLFPDLHIVVFGILRGERAIVPTSNDQMLPGDEVYFMAETSHLARALAIFGHSEQEARRVIIIGGGNIGLSLAEMIEDQFEGVSAKLIEMDRERARHVAERLSRVRVLHGDGLDPEVLEEANVAATETVVTVTDGDEVNILAGLLAKRYGCQRAVVLINASTYTPLIGSLGIDVVVSPRAITVSTILQHIRRGRILSVNSVREGFGEVIVAEALETSPLVGKTLREAKLPDGVIVGCVVRGEEVIIARPNTVIQARDRVVLFAATGTIRRVEKLFAVRFEYF
jgi:trk system potassium uptake protein TrkA